jgi:hypothetical protein
MSDSSMLLSSASISAGKELEQWLLDGRRYFVTNDMELSSAQLKRPYRLRQ